MRTPDDVYDPIDGTEMGTLRTACCWKRANDDDVVTTQRRGAMIPQLAANRSVFVDVRLIVWLCGCVRARAAHYSRLDRNFYHPT